MKKREIISISEYISRVLSGERNNVVCNKTDYCSLMNYNNQTFIDDEGKTDIISIKKLLKVKKGIKNIYINN